VTFTVFTEDACDSVTLDLPLPHQPLPDETRPYAPRPARACATDLAVLGDEPDSRLEAGAAR
jgi:hypothetical protein